MANIIIGTNDTIGTVLCRPSSSLPHPNWNTATTTPYAAPIDSRFMTPAVNGITTDRNAAMSKRNESPTTARMNHGSRAAMRSPRSTYAAVTPPT